MKVICVDDERLLMEDTVAMCRELPEISEATGFTSANAALEWLRNHHVDLALLDIDMPDMKGIDLAAKVKEMSPDTAIIFLTGYAQYAVEAFAVRASGYLLKPVGKAALAADVSFISLSKESETKLPQKRVSVKTFGMFEVYVESRPVKFHMAKCKELLAYLVDRQGSSVSRAQLASILWEDRPYDRKLQKQLDVYIRSMRNTLAEYGISDIVQMQRGTLRIVPEEIDCDAYKFFAGDAEAVNSYRGEYMSSYSWSSITEGVMFWQQSSKKSTE